MTIAEVNIKKNDLQPYYYCKVVDSDDAEVDLTGATIVCTMKNKSDATLKINRQSAGIVISNQVTNEGEFRYEWEVGDTDTVGGYNIEFEITPLSGGKYTVPAKDTKLEAIVNINSSLDTV